MDAILDWHERLSERTVTAARTSQALAIGALDRVVGSPRDEPRVVNRLLHTELDVIGSVLADPGRLVDQTYDVVQRLVALHREFARRLFEVVDARDDGLSSGDPQGHLATVLPMHRIGAHQG